MGSNGSGTKASTMANASANRLIQVPHRGLSLVLKTIFHNAMVKALLDDQWLTIIIKHPHAEETNASGCMTTNHIVNSNTK